MRVFEKGHSVAKKKRQHLKDRVWLRVAMGIAAMGTCHRRKVGAVFLDDKGRVLSTGYNGVAPDELHCTEHKCPGADMPSGTGLEMCQAIHAEQNAIAQCKFPDAVHTVYCTDSPCAHCIKMLATTGAKRIVFAREYPHSASKHYWEARGGLWEHHPIHEPSDLVQKQPESITEPSWIRLVWVFFNWVAVWRR